MKNPFNKDLTYQEELQMKNPNPAKRINKTLVMSLPRENFLNKKSTIKNQKQIQDRVFNQPKCEDELIDKLEKGDMFGEIGLLTSIRRTCTVQTTECSLLLKLSEVGLENI